MTGAKFHRRAFVLPAALKNFIYTQPTLIHLRDGEVVLFRRGDSPLWQCRFKLQDGSWHRTSTKRTSIEHAVTVATTLYDEARFRPQPPQQAPHSAVNCGHHPYVIRAS